jgi:hypothetical protein
MGIFFFVFRQGDIRHGRKSRAAQYRTFDGTVSIAPDAMVEQGALAGLS